MSIDNQFARRLQEALTDAPNATPQAEPLIVDVQRVPVFRWRATIARDAEGAMAEVIFEPIEQLPWIEPEASF